MALRKISVIVFIMVAVLIGAYWSHHRSLQLRHVFINETSDHRFDESIRVSILAAYKRTGVQNAVIISDRENENELARVAAETFKDLNLGKSTQGRAILYYFSPKARALKIEIGHALEGVLPDLTVKNLEMAAKSFIFIDKYQDFWAELINTINIEVEKKEKQENFKIAEYDFTKFRFLSGGGGILSFSYSDSWQQLLNESRRVRPQNIDSFRAQQGVQTTVEQYLKSLEEGYGDFDLDLLESESQFFRKITPQSSYQMFRNAMMYREAGLDRIFIEQGLAFVFFKPEHPVLPLILKRREGVWRIHEPLSWSLFQRYEDSSQIFLKFPLQGLSPEMQKYVRIHIGSPIFALAKALTLEFLSQSASSEAKSSLIHLYWLDKTEYEFERVGLGSLSDDDLMLAADAQMNLGHFSKFLATYEALAKRLPNNVLIQKKIEFYRQILKFQDSDWILSRNH